MSQNENKSPAPKKKSALRIALGSLLTPDGRKYLRPVAWLGGRDLLANLKYFLLFAAFKGKLDPRDFMKAEVFPSGDDHKRVHFGAGKNEEGEEEFWFDYFADSGDGMTAGYAIAYLCMTDLYARLPDGWNQLPGRERTRLIENSRDLGEIRSRLVAFPDDLKKVLDDYSEEATRDLRTAGTDVDSVINLIEKTPGMVRVDKPGPTDQVGWRTLPRGAFLFVGGDTAYHVADFAGLGLRFQKTFEWAFEDLTRGMTKAQKKELWREPNRRPIFGVPGNHDYYDMIDGFNRQFGRPVTRETNYINLSGKDLPPQLRLWTFKRFQTASYVAIKMPFDWWLWGVDSELPTVDIRQQEFFKRSYSLYSEPEAREQVRQILKADHPDTFDESELDIFPRISREDTGDRWPIPRKLIVATSEPTTVEGKCKPEDDKTCQAFRFLDLKRPFLYQPANPEGDPELEKKEKSLVDFHCRLDISGDVHHYARYWGDEEDSNYASVVSGGGGASMSPTQTDYGQIMEHAVYPSKKTSTRVINQQLFKPWVVIRGGNVWLAGLIIAAIIYLGASFPASHYDFTNSVIRNALEWNFNSIAFPKGAALVFKLSLLLLVSLGSLICAGFYSKWLFSRLTDTYDWAHDRLLNLGVKEPKNEEDRLRIEASKASFGNFLDKIEKQLNAGVDLPKCLGFLLLGLANAAVAFLFLALEFTAYGPFDFSSVPLVGNPLTTITTWFASTAVAQYLAHSSPLVYAFIFSALLAIAVFTMAATAVVSKKKSKTACKKIVENNEAPPDVAISNVKHYTVTPSWDYLPFWGLLLFPGLGCFGLVIFEYRRSVKFGTLPMFGNSVLIFLALAAAGGAAIVAMYYSKWLFDQSYRLKVNVYSYLPATALSITAVIFVGVALSLFARQQGRLIVTDTLYLIALVGIPVGCIVLAAYVGNHNRTVMRSIGFGIMGLWHGVLQLVVPFALVWVGNRWALLAALLVVAAMIVLPWAVLRVVTLKTLDKGLKKIRTLKVLLAAAWFIYGAVILVLPWWQHRDAPGFLVISRHPRVSIIASFVLVGLLGALMSCVWLGWYFAVALVFNGHANEAGSTARTEDYKHFIRFRLTENTLTGYVIAVDFPHGPQAIPPLIYRIVAFIKNGFKPDTPLSGDDRSRLTPRLVDVFTLTCPPGE